MAERDDDLDIAHLFRVIFLQGGQVAVGTAIGAGVLLLVGIVGVLLSPILVPIFLYMYWRQEKAKKAAGQASAEDMPEGSPVGLPDARNAAPESGRGGVVVPPGV